jgi:hypothetical protein
MEPKINGITGSYLIPHVPSKKYKFAEFLPFTAQEMTDGGLKKKSCNCSPGWAGNRNG